MWTGCAPAGLGWGAGPAIALYSIELDCCQRSPRKGIRVAYRLLFQWWCYVLAPLSSRTAVVVMLVVEVKHAKMRQARDRPRRTIDFPRFIALLLKMPFYCCAPRTRKEVTPLLTSISFTEDTSLIPIDAHEKHPQRPRSCLLRHPRARDPLISLHL